MSKISPLFSGSTGNVTYIGTEKGAILIDAGVSGKKILESLALVDGRAEEIKAVAVTHEHIDHICGLKPILNKTSAALLASPATLDTLIKLDKVPKNTRVIPLEEQTEEICGMGIKHFATSHDCEGSGGYRITLPDGKIFTLCTDLGMVTDEVRKALSGSHLTLIESNHDVEMLKKGPYPPHLKVRILSDKGHISNAVCADELKRLLREGTNRFILGHLSQNNNTPLVARSCSEAALMDLSAINGKDYLLSVARPCGNGVTIL